MPTTWKIKNNFEHDIETYLKEVKNISPMLARILMNRDVAAKDAQKMVNAPLQGIVHPGCIHGAEEAAAQIANYIKQDKIRFFVFADYDVDGLTSGFIMGSYLNKYHETVVKYPERNEGYGLSMTWSKALVAEYENHKDETWVVVTVDNGITKHAEVQYLSEHGVQVIITDHHEPIMGEPPALAVCDPKLTYDPSNPAYDLCGAAVAWYICMIVDDILNDDENGERIRSYLPYVAVATISDVMPLTPSNSSLVNLGLKEINSKKQDAISSMMEAIDISFPLTAKKVGWEIGPRLNACGRMNDIGLGAKLFTEADKQQIAFAIDRLNTDRKTEQKKMLKKASESYDENESPFICIVVAEDAEYPGIAGGVAGQLADKYHHPAIILNHTGDLLSGSARSYGCINLIPAFEKAQSLNIIEGYGGHAQAAGVSLKPSMLQAFRKFMNEYLGSLPQVETAEPDETIMIDGELNFGFVTREAYNEINRIPYDKDIMPEPRFIFRNVTVEDTKFSKNNPNNVQFTFIDARGNRRKFWAWGKGDDYKRMGKPKLVDVIATIDECGFGFDKGNIILSNIDFRKAEPELGLA